MNDMKMVFMKWMTFTRSWLIWGLLWFGLKEPVFGQQKNQNPVTEYEDVLSTLLDKASGAEDLKRIKPEIEKILQNWKSTTFVQEIRKRDPAGSFLFLKMCLEMEVDQKMLEKWVLMMPESVGVEYELLQKDAAEEENVQALMNRAGGIEQLLDFLLGRENGNQLSENGWHAVVDAMMGSGKTSHDFLKVVRKHDSFPEPFLDQAEWMAYTRNYPGKWGFWEPSQKTQLLGAYLLSFRMPEGAGEDLRRAAEKLIQTHSFDGYWEKELKEISLSPDAAFILAGVRTTFPKQRPDATFGYLADIFDGLGEDEIFSRLQSHPASLDFLEMYGRIRPQLVERAGLLMLDEIEGESNTKEIRDVSMYYREHKKLQAPMGRMDNTWLAVLKKQPEDLRSLLLHASNLGVSPALIWEEIEDMFTRFTVDQASDYYLQFNIYYIVKNGDKDLVREVFSAMEKADVDDAERAQQLFWFIVKDVYRFRPELAQEYVSLQMGLWVYQIKFYHRSVRSVPKVMAAVPEDKQEKFFDYLIAELDESLKEGGTGQERLVMALGHVRDQNERVLPYLQSVVDMHLHPVEGKTVSDKSAEAAMKGLERLRRDEVLPEEAP